MANIGIEVSEIMAGVAMLMPPKKLEEYSKDMGGLVNFLKEGKKLASSNKFIYSEGLKQKALQAFNPTDRDFLTAAVQGISAARSIRDWVPIRSKESGTAITRPVCDKVYLTGDKWPSDVKKYEVEAYGFKSYNSSDIIFQWKNPKGLAIILGVEEYDDDYYPILEYSNRDKSVIRSYFSEAFGLSDFQMLPSKSWQMDGGPSLEDFNSTFDPHQGDLRKRIITAEKYSGIKEVDIYLYYRGYGEWLNGKPFLIPKDAKVNRDVSKYPLEQLMKNISVLSVMKNIKTITIFLDITYVNPKASNDLIWDFQNLSDKICILSASSNGQNSQIFYDKKHSVEQLALLQQYIVMFTILDIKPSNLLCIK